MASSNRSDLNGGIRGHWELLLRDAINKIDQVAAEVHDSAECCTPEDYADDMELANQLYHAIHLIEQELPKKKAA